MIVAGRLCGIRGDENPEYRILQPIDRRNFDAVLDAEFSFLRENCRGRLMLAGFAVEDWNSELSPWPAPPVWGKEGFAGQAGKTLDWLKHSFLPMLPKEKTILGGYSLAGLFALWAGSETDDFDAVAAASPSVWFPGYLDYEAKKPIRAESVYLSLGNREEKTKNPTMSAVGNAIRELDSRLEMRGIRHLLAWNEGNHFREPEIRTAKGFCWAVREGY